MRRILVVVALATVVALGVSACGGGSYMNVGVSAGPWGIQPNVGLGWTGRPF